MVYVKIINTDNVNPIGYGRYHKFMDNASKDLPRIGEIFKLISIESSTMPNEPMFVNETYCIENYYGCRYIANRSSFEWSNNNEYSLNGTIDFAGADYVDNEVSAKKIGKNESDFRFKFSQIEKSISSPKVLLDDSLRFSKNEILEILKQNKNSDEIILDLMDHITN